MTKRKFCLFLFCLLTLEARAFAQPQVRIGIMPFMSRSREITANQATQVTDIMTRILSASPSIFVIERERLRVIAMEHGLNIGAVNQDSAMKIGHLAGCQYILLGSVTQLTQKYLSSRQASRFLFSNFYGDENQMQESTATLEARLIDVTTGRIALSFSQSGSALISSNDSKKSHSGSDLAMQAIEAASSRLGDEVREVLADERAMIISVSKRSIRINRGKASGVQLGALYRVYEEGKELFDLNGASLGKKSINRAIVRVIDVSNEFSAVEVLEGKVTAKPESKKPKKEAKATAAKKTGRAKKGKGEDSEPSSVIIVREGDKIEAISFSEAEKLTLNPAGRN